MASVGGKQAPETVVPRPGMSKARQARTRMTVKVMTQTLQALDELGGVDFLVDIGRKDPRVFIGMLKGVMSQQVDVVDTTGLAAVLEQRLNNAREIGVRHMQTIAAQAAAAPAKASIPGEARSVDPT
jgi:hypothetical protein